MICYFLAVLVLAPLALTSDVSITEVEDSFHKFMEQFSIDQIQIARTISSNTFAQLKAEHDDDLSVSEYEILQQSDYSVGQKIEMFRPTAHEIFLDAAYNRNNDYYLFDEERSLWRKPDQDFEKVLFNGLNRNRLLLEDKISLAWEQAIDGSSSALKKRTWWTSFDDFFRGVKFSMPRLSTKQKVLSSLWSNKRFRIAIQGTAVVGVITTIAILIWKIDRSHSFDGENIDGGTAVVASGNSRNKTELIYRLGKKVLTDDVNTYCK